MLPSPQSVPEPDDAGVPVPLVATPVPEVAATLPVAEVFGPIEVVSPAPPAPPFEKRSAVSAEHAPTASANEASGSAAQTLG